MTDRVPIGWLRFASTKPSHAIRHPAASPLFVSNVSVVIVKSKLKSTGRTDFVACATTHRTVRLLGEVRIAAHRATVTWPVVSTHVVVVVGEPGGWNPHVEKGGQRLAS